MKHKYTDDIEDIQEVENLYRPLKTVKLKSKIKPIKKHSINTKYNHDKRS